MPLCSRVKSCYGCLPVRIIVLISVSLLHTLIEMERWLTNYAISEMTFSPTEDDSYPLSQCPYMMRERWPDHEQEESGTYLYWDVNLNAALMSGFSLGNLLTQILGGIIADVYGSRRLVIAALVVYGSLTLLQPLAASFGQHHFILIRIILGMSQGFLLPSPYSILARWAPINERSRFVAFPVLGNFCGYVFAYVLKMYTPELWTLKLYAPGVFSLLLAVFWYCLTHSEPAACPYITEGERNHIGQETVTAQNLYVPWGRMLTCPPLTTLLLYYIGYNCISYVIWNQQFYYMINVLHITSTVNSLNILMSHSGMLASALIWGSASDWLVNNGYMSRTNNRKWFGMAAVWLVVPQLFLTFMFNCNVLAIALVYTCVHFTRGLAAGTVEANVIDLGPRFAGVIYSIMLTSHSLSVLVGEIVTQKICNDVSETSCWVMMDAILVPVVCVCTLPWLWFGSTTVQPWNSHLRPPQRRSPNAVNT